MELNPNEIDEVIAKYKKDYGDEDLDEETIERIKRFISNLDNLLKNE